MNTLAQARLVLEAEQSRSGCCAVGRWYAALSEEDQENFDAILALDLTFQRKYDQIEELVPFSLTTFKTHIRRCSE